MSPRHPISWDVCRLHVLFNCTITKYCWQNLNMWFLVEQINKRESMKKLKEQEVQFFRAVEKFVRTQKGLSHCVCETPPSTLLPPWTIKNGKPLFDFLSLDGIGDAGGAVLADDWTTMFCTSQQVLYKPARYAHRRSGAHGSA